MQFVEETAMAGKEKDPGEGLSRAEQVELQWKEMQIRLFQRQLREQDEKDEENARRRDRQIEDYKKGEGERLRRQTVCKHKKGGRDNKFARGTAAEYSVNMNTYPSGEKVIMCTRCGKEVAKPSQKLKKSDPKLFASMAAEWEKWNDYTTDNSPSGGKIFEIERAA
jgi:hypothetical protein